MRKISDIVRNRAPVTLPPSATVREACRAMRDYRIGAVLVTEGDHRLLGIFTARDAVHRVLSEGKSAARTKPAEVMTHDPTTMPPGRTQIEAVATDGRRALSTCPSRRWGQSRGNRFAFRFQRYRTGSPGRRDWSVGANLTAKLLACLAGVTHEVRRARRGRSQACRQAAASERPAAGRPGIAARRCRGRLRDRTRARRSSRYRAGAQDRGALAARARARCGYRR